MPRKGSKTITVSDAKHKEALKICKKLEITLKIYVEALIGTIPPSLLDNSNIEQLQEVAIRG